MRKAHFEKAQSQDKQKFKSKELVLQYFVVFLKCILEKDLVVSNSKRDTENYSSSQQKIPQDDTQVWDQGAHNCRRTLDFGQEKWELPLVEGYTKGNECGEGGIQEH